MTHALKVVIKVIDVSSMPAEEKKATRREVSILRCFDHPCIIRHLGSFEDRGNLCIVTDFAERGDLSHQLKGRKGVFLPESQVWKWFVQICLALSYIHRQKILHRYARISTGRLAIKCVQRFEATKHFFDRRQQNKDRGFWNCASAEEHVRMRKSKRPMVCARTRVAST